MAGYIVCVCTSGVTAGGNNKDIIALNGKNGDVPLEGIGPSPYLYDHHSIAQEAVGFAVYGRPATNAEWEPYKANAYDINDARNRTLLGGAYVSDQTAINFGAFKNGMYQITGFTVTRTGNSGEGAAIYVDLTTLAIPTGITIYWTITSITGAAQNGMTPSSGSTVVTSTAPGNWPGTAARITLTPDLDNITEGAGSFVMQIRQGGVGSTVFYTSGAIAVADTSLYPYFNSPATSIDEGSSVTFNISGYDITSTRSPATYYWSINTNAARFSGATNGSVVITNNAGSFSVSAIPDLTTNGAVTAQISLRLTSISGPIIQSINLTVNDTSLTPAFTSPTVAQSINEGSAQSFSVSGFTNGQAFTWYWRINHITTVAADFSGSVDSGTFTINNGGSFSITAVSDTLSDGSIVGLKINPRNETFSVIISRTSGGTAVATSPVITINDTSRSPFNPIYWTFSANAVAATICIGNLTSQGGATISGGYYVACTGHNNLNIVINASTYVYSNNVNWPALEVKGGIGCASYSDNLTITVNGYVMGKGGDGGCKAVGYAGGIGIDISGLTAGIVPTINGSGYVVGGGGGGGSSSICNQSSGTGGGGAGGGNSTGNGGVPGGAGYNGYRYYPSGNNYGLNASGGGGGGRYIGVNTFAAYGAGNSSNTCPGGNGGKGGNQGGGGGRYWCFTGNGNGRIVGGTGGNNNAVGGNAPDGVSPTRLIGGASGGGGGYGAAGGSSGSASQAGKALAGGAGGKAVNLGSRTANTSGVTFWGAVS